MRVGGVLDSGTYLGSRRSAGRPIIDTSGHPYEGIIWNVDPGSYQLILYREGILGLHVPFWNRMAFALKYVRAGAPVTIDSTRRLTREERRIQALTESGPPFELASGDDQSSFFIPEHEIKRVTVRYRVAFAALDIWTTTVELEPKPRTFGGHRH